MRQTRPDQTRPEPFHQLRRSCSLHPLRFILSLLNARARKDESTLVGRRADARGMRLRHVSIDSQPGPHGGTLAAVELTRGRSQIAAHTGGYCCDICRRKERE